MTTVSETSTDASFDCGYGNVVVVTCDGLSFTPGKTSILLGYNGSGKSTFLKTLCRVIPPVRGEVLVKSACLLPEELDFCGDLKPRAMMAAVCSSYPYSELVLESLEISRNKMFKQLSKGNRQKFRIALTEALGFCLERSIMCLDEPLSGLDLRMRETIIGAWEGRGELGEVWGRYRGHRIISQHSGKTVEDAVQTLVAWSGRIDSKPAISSCEDWPAALGYTRGGHDSSV